MKAVVVGAGAIGASWVALCREHDFEVVVVDPDPGASDRIRAAVHRYRGRDDDFSVSQHLASSVADADVVFECGPEILEVKQQIVEVVDAHAPLNCLILSSSSGLVPSDLQRGCHRRPGRVLVAHPFNPPHLMPLVEVVGGVASTPEDIDRAMALLRSLGRHPIHVRAEVPGHVANRLQAALWREAYSLLVQGVVSAADLDAAIANGPGLRWALLGPLATQHLSSGTGGIAANLAHLGPAIESWWADLGQVSLTPDVIRLLAEGVDAELGGESPESVATRRDAALRDLLALKDAHGLSSGSVAAARDIDEDKDAR